MASKIIPFVKITCSILTLCTLIFLAWATHQYAPEIIAWINKLGWLGPILFLITYCLATILLLPTMILTLAGGAIFGPVFGTILNLFGATLGAACAFLITRHLLYDWFNQKKGDKLNRLINGVEKRGWLFIALLRLFPIIPFNLVNYGLGITNIKFSLYLILTFIFLIPAEIIYTSFGYAGMDVLSHSGTIYKNGGIILSGCIILGISIVKYMKKTL
jgi:uncharacterized membrane protein YdjX (TVP38/TMEM64 family)